MARTRRGGRAERGGRGGRGERGELEGVRAAACGGVEGGVADARQLADASSSPASLRMLRNMQLSKISSLLLMSEGTKRVSPSLSGDPESDPEFIEEAGDNSSGAPGRPGRKKNPNSQAARRDQNRIAQREFRLRKQQRIRDLEARVEILSGSKDETYLQMREIINELIAENQTLRNMVRSLSGFIGDGAGGFLPRMGWTLPDFEAFLRRADTDTAFEAFAKRKRAVQDARGAPPDKRAAPDDAAAPRKRARTAAGDGGGDSGDGGSGGGGGGGGGGSSSSGVFGGESAFSPPGAYAPPFPGADVPALELYPGLRAPPPGFAGGFLGGLGGAEAPFLPPSFSAGGRDAFPAPPYAAGPGAPPLQSMPFLHSAAASATPPSGASEAAAEDVPDDAKAQEARKLVGYHLENYRRNAAYCLPPSLRPTLVQRTVAHEGIIDGIPHPELRNRMILLRGRFNLAECIHSYLTSTVIHGDDVLGHANWEIEESWLKKYGYLVDPTTLGLTNRWRKERGESELQMSDIAPSEQLPGLAQP